MVERLVGDQIFGEAQALEAVVRRRRVAAERAGVDIDGIENRIALGDALGLADRDEGRRLAVDGGGGDRVGDGVAGRRAGDENHIDLVVADGGGERARIDRRDRDLVARHAVVPQDEVEQVRVRLGPGHDADTAAGELRDFVERVGRGGGGRGHRRHHRCPRRRRLWRSLCSSRLCRFWRYRFWRSCRFSRSCHSSPSCRFLRSCRFCRPGVLAAFFFLVGGACFLLVGGGRLFFAAVGAAAGGAAGDDQCQHVLADDGHHRPIGRAAGRCSAVWRDRLARRRSPSRFAPVRRW